MVSYDGPERRRGTRVVRVIPVTVESIDALGQPFKEDTLTVAINPRGCTYQSKHYVPKRSIVTLEITQPESGSPARRIRGRVTSIERPRSIRDLFKIGLEFERPENIWGIEFPPDDRPTPSDDGKKPLTSHDPHKFDADRDASDLVEYVEEIIVEESSEDTTEDHIVAPSQLLKTDDSGKAHQKKRKKKKKKKAEKKKWDVFLCHASEDKDSFVRPLANALKAAGLRVWYDEFTLRVGAGLRRSIDKGLQESKFGAVIISPSFFQKQWPQRELDGLIAKETDDRRVILPVWHNVSQTEVREHSITLADRIAANSAEGIQAVVAKLLLTIREND
jgi:TIR domain